ncbi:MAG: hypothetical protein GQ527_11580 [Bacteroidales bacterium]|nr:hypothetical protein [Bacteroidales bacterium]
MELQKSFKNRKIGVVLTYLSLLSALLVFEYAREDEWNIIFKIIEVISIILFVVSFIFTYVKTGLWRFTHQPLIELDEREVILISKSLRYAYTSFTILVLLLLMSFALTNASIDMVLVASLIIFAHLLPASIIAWTEKVV